MNVQSLNTDDVLLSGMFPMTEPRALSL